MGNSDSRTNAVDGPQGLTVTRRNAVRIQTNYDKLVSWTMSMNSITFLLLVCFYLPFYSKERLLKMT